MSSEAVSVFTKLIHEKHESLKVNYQKLIYQMVSENKESKVKHTKILLTDLKSLANNLPNNSQPHWLRTLISEANLFLGNTNKINDWINQLTEHKKSVLDHNWNFNIVQTVVYNADDIYQEIKIETKIDDLFNSLIDQLKQIIKSDQIDSITVKESLKGLMELLEQNKHSSYLGLRWSIEFTSRFVLNTAWVSIKSIPVIKQIVEGFEKTLKQMKITEKDVSNEIRKRLNNNFNSSLDNLPEKDKYLLEYKDDNEN